MNDVILQAEIEYQKEDGTWVHSDIEPRGCKFKDLDDEHRKFLHSCLDEWIDNSRGTGCFYIKNEKFVIDQERQDLPCKEWVYHEDPHIPGWYAVMYCWEPEEGLFTKANTWDGNSWEEEHLPIVAYAGPFGTRSAAEKWAKERDSVL